jgi:hypothetical protein
MRTLGSVYDASVVDDAGAETLENAAKRNEDAACVLYRRLLELHRLSVDYDAYIA